MNGQGATGYCYYENVPQGEYAWVEKQGQFVDDEMEGSISYEIRGTDDTLSHWDMNVSQGKIQFWMMQANTSLCLRTLSAMPI